MKFRHNDTVWIKNGSSALSRQLNGTVQIIDRSGISDKYGNWYALKMFDEKEDGVVWEKECSLHEQGEFYYQLSLIVEEFKNA